MSTFGAIGEFAIGEVPSGTTSVDTYQWFQQWVDPPARAPSLASARNQAVAAPAWPDVNLPWFAALAEPKRFPRRLEPTGSPFEAFIPDLRYISIGWYEQMSEPQRFPEGLRASDHPDHFRAIPPFRPPYARGYVIT